MKRPYECKVAGCDKSYTTRFSLRRHIASHSAIKQHVCVLCFKTFTLAQYLKEHMYIHTKQKPFKCDFEGCSRAFRQAGKLSMHKKVHQNIIFSIQRVKRNRLDASQIPCISDTRPLRGAPSGPAASAQDAHRPKRHAQAQPALVSSPSRVIIPSNQINQTRAERDRKSMSIGQETENELSLSREDDSDESVESLYEERQHFGSEPREAVVSVDQQQFKSLSQLSQKQADGSEYEAMSKNEEPQVRQQLHCDRELCDISDSESVENSAICEGSDYDEMAQRREEQSKLAQIFSTTRGGKTTVGNVSKVKLPYEMLITKLIDGLETPELIKSKALPLPDVQPATASDEDKQEEEEVAASQKAELQLANACGLFATKYQSQATATSVGPEPTMDQATAPRQLFNVAQMQAQSFEKVAQLQQSSQGVFGSRPPQQHMQIVHMPLQPQFYQQMPAQPICYQLPQMAPMQSGAPQQFQLVQILPTNFAPVQLQPVQAFTAPLLMQYAPMPPAPTSNFF